MADDIFPFAKGETLDRDLQPDCLASWRRHQTQPHFFFRTMILVTSLGEFLTRLSALHRSFVEPLSVFAADLILLSRHSSLPGSLLL